jgi:hypothetical protein
MECCKRHGMIAGRDGERCYQCISGRLEWKQPPTVTVCLPLTASQPSSAPKALVMDLRRVVPA